MSSTPGKLLTMGKNARLKAVHKMGNDPSQRSEPIDGGFGTQLPKTSDKEVVVEVPKENKKRRSSGAIENGEDGHSHRDETHKPSHKKRKKKAKSKSVEGTKQRQEENDVGRSPPEEDNAIADDQEDVDFREPDNEVAENAQLLLSLRNGVAAAEDDDVAASGQLIAKTSSVKSRKPKKLVKGGQGEGRSKGVKGRGKSDASTVEPTSYEASQPDDNWAIPLAPLPNMPTGNRKSVTPPPVELPDLPQSIQSLDDIPSDDENLAPFLQTYENGGLGLNYGMDEPGEQQAIESPYRALATKALQETLEASGATDQNSPDGTLVSRLRAADRSTKRARKRNKNLPNTIFDTDDDEIGGDQNEPVADDVDAGQYMKSCTHSDLLLMLSFTLADQIPIDPKLTEQGFSGFRVEGYQHSEPEVDEASRPLKTGKLKRVPKIRKRATNVQNSTLDDFVIRGQDPFGVPNGDEEPGQATDEEGHDNEESRDDQPAPSPNRRKRRMPNIPGDPNQPSFSVKQKVSSQKPRAEYNPSILELADSGGQFTEEEYNTVLAFRDEWCTENGKTHHQFADKIHANARNDPKLGQFWTLIQNLLPYRKRQPLQKFCRRKFHNFDKRGAWTKEDDDILKQAVAEKGRSWKAVGELCDRMAEDVRDRWRNYHQNSSNRNHEAWTEGEVKALVRAVGEVIWLQLEEHRRQFLAANGYHDALPDTELGDELLEKLILWQAVSDRMDGQRGRLQCSYKWKALKTAKPDALAETLRGAKKRMERLQAVDVRVEAARARVRTRMLPGDRYDFLTALQRCGATTEYEIQWTTLGAGAPWRQKWKLIDVRAMWDVMRSEPTAVAVAAAGFLNVVHALLLHLSTTAGDRLNERWIPAPQPPSSPNASRRKARGKGKRGRGALSGEFVGALDEGVDEDDDPYYVFAPYRYGDPSAVGLTGLFGEDEDGDGDARLASLLRAAT